MDAKVLGIFETVDFPQFSIKNVVAKIDSGAYTGALHCTTITQEDTPDGPVIHFSPFDFPDVKITTKDFYLNDVKSSNGKIELRYFLKTTIVIQGETYDILLSLADRSSMKSQVIIGRRFIRKHNFLLDANKVYKRSLTKLRSDKR
jgi:hypothetical protein